MPNRQYICFKNKEEILNNGDRKPIGNLLFTFLDSDFYKLKLWIENTQKRINMLPHDENSVVSLDKVEEKPYFIFASTYQLVMRRLETFHPMFSYCFDIYLERIRDEKYGEMNVGAELAHNIFRKFPGEEHFVETIANFKGNDDKILCDVTALIIEGALKFFDKINQLRQDLFRLIEQVLDVDGEDNKLKPIQRLYDLQISENELIRKYYFLHNKLRIDYKILSEKGNLNSQIFYSAEDLRALIYFEFEYMAAQNISVKKCEFCEQYFLPFSKNSIYCDRIAEGYDKTCKQVAPSLKQKEKMSKEKIDKLYHQLSNRYGAQHRRSPHKMTRERLIDWRTFAKNLKRQYTAGKISFYDFEMLIDMTEWLGNRAQAEQRAGMR